MAGDSSDSLFVLGRVEEAGQAFERALRINPGDISTRALVRQQKKDYGGAPKAIAKGLLYDGAGGDSGGAFAEAG